MAKNFSPQKKITASPSARLVLIAGLSGLIYLSVFTIPFPLPRLYSTIPPLDYTKLTNYSAYSFIAYVVGLGVLFWLYVGAIRLTTPAGERRSRGAGEKLASENGGRRSAVGGRLMGISSTVLATTLLFSYPVTAIDLFIYAIRARGWALYDLNPLSTAPETMPAADPWLGLAAEWVDAPSPYGPLWEWLSLGAFHLSGGNFLAHLIALKILAVLAYLGCTWLIYRIMHQLQPRWTIPATLAFSWSPLVLLESIQNGHNDIVMVFFLLAAIWVMNERIGREAWRINPFAHLLIRHSLVCTFLALSILVKFVTILVVPFFLLALTASETNWLKRLALMSGYGLLIALLVIVPLLPLWPGWNNWAVLQAGSGAGRSLLALLVLSLKDSWGVSPAFDFSRNLLFGLYVLIYLYCLFSSQKSVASSQKISPLLPCSPTPLLPCSFYVLFWYVLLATPVFHAWYLLWFLPLAVLLLPNWRPLIATTVFSVTALFIIPYFETVRVWYPALLSNQFLGHLIGVPLLVVPPALALLWPISRSPESEV